MKLISFGDELVKGNKAPKLLSEMLDYEFVDYAKNDTSNQSLFRDVIHFVTSANTKKMFILIGWTENNRLDLSWRDDRFTYRPYKRDYNDNGINALHGSDSVIFNDILVSQQRSAEAYALQETLLNLNINYYMYNTQDCINFNYKSIGNLKNIKGQFYHNPLNKDSSMKYYLEKHGFSLDDKGHICWAEFLYSKIKASYQ